MPHDPTPPSRAALERLVCAYDNNEGLPIAEWIAAARAALAAEPVGEGPSDNDLRAMASKLVKICVDDYGYVYDVLPFARAVLARWGRPATPPAPEPGEVEKLVGWLRNGAVVFGTCSDWGPCLTRAATLLEQFRLGGWIVPTVEEAAHAPAVVSGEVHFEFAVVDGDYLQQAGGTAPTYSQALDEGRHYLAQYLQDGPHTLEIRRIEQMPQVGEGADA